MCMDQNRLGHHAYSVIQSIDIITSKLLFLYIQLILFFFLCFQLLLLNITQIPADQNRNNDLKLYYKPHTPSLPVKH